MAFAARLMPRPKTSPSKPAKPIAKTIAKPKSKPKVKWAKPKEPKAKSPATEALKALQQRGLPEETIAHRVAALMTGTHAATRDTHLAVSAHTFAVVLERPGLQAVTVPPR